MREGEKGGKGVRMDNRYLKYAGSDNFHPAYGVQLKRTKTTSGVRAPCEIGLDGLRGRDNSDKSEPR